LSAKHGLAQQHLNVGAVKRTLIPVPSLDEQREIDAALAIVERKLALHMSKHAALTVLFRTLLHQLMTAQIRVHGVDFSDLGVDCETMDKPEACQPLAGG
jgi:type I restriction enzyme S subunit